jgi:hypothetical protein
MTVTVEEAIAVLRDAANSPRSRAALSTLEVDLTGPGRREPESDKPSGRPFFPTKESAAEHYDSGDDKDSARGGHSPDGARGTATARKGT